jgi:hypothetical protein
MKITVIGKKGCTKCSKMAMILESKGHSLNLVYPESSCVIDGIQVNLVDGMHYPLYILNDRLVDNFKDLNQMLTTPSPRAEEP